jgi:ACS family glucarate transporter-like MFS transporter
VEAVSIPPCHARAVRGTLAILPLVENFPASPASARPTRVRYGVVGLMVALAMVTYLDRACIGKLAPDISRDLALSKEQMSVVFSAFALAYALFEVPTAWWADRRGTRGVLTRIVLWWSALTMMTAAAFNHVSLVVIRFLFGAGEAGAWPCVARTFSKWIPPLQRGRVQGIFFAGAHLAGGLTPIVAAMLNNLIGWRWVFVVFGATGVVWVIAWQRWFRDDPAQHPATNAAERELITAGRTPVVSQHEGWPYWRRLLAHRNTLPLCLGYIPNSTAFYFCITWLPTYLEEKHKFAALSLGLFAGLPLMTAVVGDLFGGAATDWAVRRFGLRFGRAGVAGFGNLLAGGAMISATLVPNPVAAICLISLAVTATMFTLGATWSTCQDIGGQHVGVVSAAMNTAGQLGAIGGPPMVTFLLARYGDWNAPVLAIGALFLVGATMWLIVDPREKVFE